MFGKIRLTNKCYDGKFSETHAYKFPDGIIPNTVSVTFHYNVNQIGLYTELEAKIIEK